MKRVRLLVIGFAAVFTVGMVLWAIDFVLRAQAAIALLSPLLAQLFLIAVISVAVAAIIGGLYYFRAFLKPQRRSPPTLPKAKGDVAAVDYRRSCRGDARSEEHTSELQSRPHISYAVFCLKKKNNPPPPPPHPPLQSHSL